jgi:ABC-type phosphate/phosphonate transport system substrate-binding protein
MRGTAPILALVLASASLAYSQAGSDEFLICYPNAPGSGRSAEPIMARFGQFLSDRLGRGVTTHYFNALEPGAAWLQDHSPSAGILSLSLYLRWHGEKGLIAMAHAERGGSSEERYRLLVKKDSSYQSLADLKKLDRPARVWSAHLDDPRFATNVVFAGQLKVEGVLRNKVLTPAFKGGRVRVVSTTRALSVLRRLLRGQDYKGQPIDAVLVSETVWEGLQQLKRYKGVFRVLYTSKTFPTPPVVRFKGGDAKRAEALGKVLTSMKSDSEGAAIMKSLQVTAFTAPQAKRLASLVKLYEAKVE